MDSLPSVYILEIDKNVSIYIQNKFDNFSRAMLIPYIKKYSDLQCLHACQAVECSIFKSLDLVIVQWSKKKIRRQRCNHKCHLQ